MPFYGVLVGFATVCKSLLCVQDGNVAAGASCNINETFKPTTSSIRTASVSISDNAQGSPETVPLTSVGTTPGVMLSPTSLNFAAQLVTTASALQNVTLTNNGNSTLGITGIAIAGANSGDFSETNTCGASVSAAANCTISVTFKPTATGNRPASVTITDDAAGSAQTIALTAIGTDFSIWCGERRFHFCDRHSRPNGDLQSASLPREWLQRHGRAEL
jgi:centrosomal CEP192-like protein